MNSRVKFAVLLVAVILASILTSYITTTTLNSNNQITSNDTQTLTKVFPVHKEEYSTTANWSIVTVFSSVPIKNITIVYNYTALDGSNHTEQYSYGDYFPEWGPNNLVEPNSTQFQYYQIPQSVISACSITEPIYSTVRPYDIIRYEFTVYPKLNVTVYGYGANYPNNVSTNQASNTQV